MGDEPTAAMKPASPEQAVFAEMLHRAFLRRGHQARFVAQLGHGEELLRRRVPQFPHRARASLEGHPPTLRQSDGTQFVKTTR